MENKVDNIKELAIKLYNEQVRRRKINTKVGYDAKDEYTKNAKLQFFWNKNSIFSLKF